MTHKHTYYELSDSLGLSETHNDSGDILTVPSLTHYHHEIVFFFSLLSRAHLHHNGAPWLWRVRELHTDRPGL